MLAMRVQAGSQGRCRKAKFRKVKSHKVKSQALPQLELLSP